MSTLAIDFDHTICDMDNVPTGQRMGPPLKGALDAIRQLDAQGHNIIIHSVRLNTPQGAKAVKLWLDYFKFPPLSMWEGVGKPNADCYLDDKAIRFTSWDDALARISG